MKRKLCVLYIFLRLGFFFFCGSTAGVWLGVWYDREASGLSRYKGKHYAVLGVYLCMLLIRTSVCNVCIILSAYVFFWQMCRHHVCAWSSCVLKCSAAGSLDEAYDGLRREVPELFDNILILFWAPAKLVWLIEMYLALFQFTGVLSGRMSPPHRRPTTTSTTTTYSITSSLCRFIGKAKRTWEDLRQWIKSAVLTDDTQNCACPARFDTWWGLNHCRAVLTNLYCVKTKFLV
jgi:hypothetical protein